MTAGLLVGWAEIDGRVTTAGDGLAAHPVRMATKTAGVATGRRVIDRILGSDGAPGPPDTSAT